MRCLPHGCVLAIYKESKFFIYSNTKEIIEKCVAPLERVLETRGVVNVFKETAPVTFVLRKETNVDSHHSKYSSKGPRFKGTF